MNRISSSPVRDALAGLVAMAVAMGIGRFVYTPILPGMMETLGLTASDAGLIASANYAGYLIGAVLAAGSWGQGRERPTAFAALALSGLLAAAMAVTQDLVVFVAIRLIAGIASAFVMVFVSTIVFERLAAAGRADLQALHFGGVGVGMAASALMILLIDDFGAGWRAGWIGSAVLSALGLLLVVMLLAKGPRQVRSGSEAAMPRSGALARIILAYGLFGFGYIVTATFLVAIVRSGAADPSFEAIVWLATGLAGAPSLWLWSRVAARIGRSEAFAIGCVVEAVGVIASVSLGGYTGPLLGGILLGGTFIAVTAIGLQIGRDLAGAAPRRVLALMTAAFGVGQIIGPIAAGLIADRTGSFVLPSLMAATALVVAAMIGLGVERGAVRR